MSGKQRTYRDREAGKQGNSGLGLASRSQARILIGTSELSVNKHAGE